MAEPEHGTHLSIRLSPHFLTLSVGTWTYCVQHIVVLHTGRHPRNLVTSVELVEPTRRWPWTPHRLKLKTTIILLILRSSWRFGCETAERSPLSLFYSCSLKTGSAYSEFKLVPNYSLAIGSVRPCAGAWLVAEKMQTARLLGTGKPPQQRGHLYRIAPNGHTMEPKRTSKISTRFGARWKFALTCERFGW